MTEVLEHGLGMHETMLLELSCKFLRGFVQMACLAPGCSDGSPVRTPMPVLPDPYAATVYPIRCTRLHARSAPMHATLPVAHAAADATRARTLTIFGREANACGPGLQ